MKSSKLFVPLAPIAMAFGLSACGGPVDVKEAVCKPDRAGIANTDPEQRFKIVDTVSGQPIFFSGDVYTRGHENLLAKAVDAVFAPRVNVRSINSTAVIQKKDEVDQQVGWEVANDLSFKVVLDNDGEIEKCSVKTKEGDGNTYLSAPKLDR